MATPFDNSVMRDGYAAALFAESAPELEEEICLIGEGPFTQPDLTRFLESIDLEATTTVEDDALADDSYFNRLPIFVVGRTGWTERTLRSLLAPSTFHEESFPVEIFGHVETFPYRVKFIYENTGVIIQKSKKCEHPKIYSQELLLLRLFSQKDPFDSSPELLARFTQDHPALCYLRDHSNFPWVSTNVGLGPTHTEAALNELPQIGLLKSLGYKVGENGLQPKARQEILSNAYLHNLPRVNSDQYMSEWGRVRTAKRLKKIAESIAAFCRNRKRAVSSPDTAVEDWETDLVWLKNTYYVGVYDGKFRWPHTKPTGLTKRGSLLQ